uniref:RING-type E3 ubiquitin transferase n=1 Tax=Fagus sylvatica TaxID=28930 RepID=A0A2N9FZP6_FAGSY
MTRPLRFLNDVTPSSSSSVSSEQPVTVDSDFVVILAALLCALICVLGLIAVARCAWLRRLSSTTTPPTIQPAIPSSLSPSVANKGLKKKILNSLPKLTFNDDSAAKFSSSSSECAICLSEFASGDQILVLPQCSHGFHVACIETWLGSHSSCPSCRQIFVVAKCQNCAGGPQADSRFKDPQDQDDPNRFLP